MEVTALFPPLRGIGKQGLQCMGEWDPHQTPPNRTPPQITPPWDPQVMPPPLHQIPSQGVGKGAGFPKGGGGAWPWL